MIKARLSNGGLILGITKENVERLQQGKPIKVEHAEIGTTSGDIFIVYGDTAQDLMDQLKPGFVEH